MLDEITDEILDMLFTNNKIKEKLYPIIYCIIGFNLILLLLVIFIAIKLHKLTNKIASLS
tara:strand:- start:938 stop:1117 length:180 start_codon:yes stop_codon:yes gene_type:complete